MQALKTPSIIQFIDYEKLYLENMLFSF